MCYHYALTKTALQVKNRYQLDIFNDKPEILVSEKDKRDPESADGLIYHVNGFSHALMPVITSDEPKALSWFSWGLIPFWVKDRKGALEIRTKTLNAKSETVFDLPSFRGSIRKKRCLIPADAFYEWRELNKERYPYHIGLTDHPVFSFAGIWESWTDKATQETFNTYAVLTTEANPLMAKIHNSKKRMPVILPLRHEADWLNPNLTDKDIKELCQPYDEGAMDAYTINKDMLTRNFKSNSPAVTEKIHYAELD